jgi:hypothetical protein
MDEELRRMRNQVNKDTALNAEELRKFGITGEDDEDPELLELMKEGDAMSNPKAGAGMKANIKDIDIDNVDINDADLDDPELLKEIGELEGQNYTQEIEEEKNKLLKEYPQLASASKPIATSEQKTEPPLTKKEARKELKEVELVPVEVPDIKDIATCDINYLETEVYSIEKIEAVSVLEEEIKLMEAKAAKSSTEDAELYTDKKNQLEFCCKMLVNSIQSGLTTQAAYMKAIQNELAHEKGLLAMLKRNKAKAEDIKRVETRIKLIEAERQPPEEDKDEPPKELKKEPTEVKKMPQEEVKKTQHGEPAPKPKLEVKKDNKAEIRSHLVIDETDIDFSKVDKEQYNTVLERLKDYIAATEYFLNNSLDKDAERLVNKVKRLKMCLQILRDGKRIDPLKMEPPLRPEILFGKDLKARITEFQVLIEKLKKQLEAQEKLARS